MRLFVCLIDSDGRGIPDAVRREHERVPRARGLEFEWRSTTGLSVLLATNDLPADSLLAGHGGWLAVGTARLDNRAELEQWAGCRGQHLSELEVVLRLVARNGAGSVLRILGDFAFLVWNGGERTGVAACDAFAVRKLHYAARTGFLAFASRAEALAIDDQYDVQFLAEWAAGAALSPGLTVYDGVRALPAGHFASVEGGRLKVQEYWSPRNIEPAPPSSIPEHEAAAMLRELITHAVRLRLGNEGNAWAQLSGGLDSSSVVSVAQWLAERGAVAHGLAGTVTYVDRQGTGADEREYSDAVVSRWGVRNETIVDPPIWCDDRDPPPL
ncbi:MAG TPA: asparagine synthase-related protein, partial [Gemmatimonadales bacterium]|nr:asparagine synthase-related protein [Gemmatimonadales bacterium]